MASFRAAATLWLFEGESGLPSTRQLGEPGYLFTMCLTSASFSLQTNSSKSALGNRCRGRNRPWLEVRFRIVDSDLQIEMPEVSATEALRNV